MHTAFINEMLKAASSRLAALIPILAIFLLKDGRWMAEQFADTMGQLGNRALTECVP